MNKFTVTGNLTKDAELKFTTGDKAYSKFTIANNEGYGDKKKTNFFNCTLWGKGAESLHRFLIKGQKVLISGKIEINKYQDKEGIEKQAIDIKVDAFEGVELLGSKGNFSENGEGSINSNYDADLTQIDDEEMPF